MEKNDVLVGSTAELDGTTETLDNRAIVTTNKQSNKALVPGTGDVLSPSYNKDSSNSLSDTLLLV